MSATPSTFAAGVTGDKIIDVTTTGYSWVLGPDRTIDWSISAGFGTETWGTTAEQTAVVTALRAILRTFEQYADIHFNYVGSFSSPTAANAGGSEINFFIDNEGRFFSSNNYLARGGFPATAVDTGLFNGAAGDVIINNRSAAAGYDFTPGSEGWTLLLHEVGHALGLKHPHDDGGTGHPTYDDAGIGKFDFDWVTIMSYEDSNPDSMKLYHAGTPMVADVLALIALYGPNIADNTGDGTYSLFGDGVWRTFLSTGGLDLVSVARSTLGWHIELPFAALSNTVPYAVGFATPTSDLTLDAPRSMNWLVGNMEDVEGSPQDDQIEGNRLANILNGGGGADSLLGFSGDDTIDGGTGNDTVAGDEGNDYLRGGDGADLIIGMNGNDDINGNKGNDNLGGGNGDDWVVGGQDDDFLTGGEGFDIVYGNLGNDIARGENGNDWVRGGQGDDVVEGGEGNDWLWGDRGSDTLTGGAGADIFHSFSGTGSDRITDFNYAQGDRVILDDRAAFAMSQVGSDTLILIGGVDQVVLMGVTAAGLAADAVAYA